LWVSAPLSAFVSLDMPAIPYWPYRHVMYHTQEGSLAILIGYPLSLRFVHQNSVGSFRVIAYLSSFMEWIEDKIQ
jgi:hypothetical protein